MVTLRRLDPKAASIAADVAAVDLLLQAAYNAPSWRFRVERGLRMQPDGWVVAERAGEASETDEPGGAARIVGCGAFLAFETGGFGWIGLVATHPDAQRQGIARAVTQWAVDELLARGCAAALDGSASGAPLYATMGFADCGLSTLLTLDDPLAAAAALAAQLPRDRDVQVRAASLAHLAAILDFDRPYFGASREPLLRSLLSEFSGRAAIAIDRTGALHGFVIAQADAIGPLVAADEITRDLLLEWALRRMWANPPRIIVPPDSAHLDAVRAAGFVDQRALCHQRLGLDALPGDRRAIVAQVSFGEA